MRFHQRLLGGGLLLVTLMFNHPVAAELSERKTGFLGRTTALSVIVQNVLREWYPGIRHVSGGLTFMCEEGSGELRVDLVMLSYRLKNSNQGSCPSAGVTFEFDSQPPLIQSWLRPSGRDYMGTVVTTHDREDPSCRSVLLMSPLQLLDLAVSATHLQAIISDVDMTKVGPSEIVEGPPLYFNLESVRTDLTELQRRCRKKK